jgi:phage terminase large subunit
LIIAPTVKILQQSTLPKFFSAFPSYQKYYKEQKGQIVFPDGRIVWIRSADSPNYLEGMTLDWIWGDEAGQFSLLVWIILRSRTAIKRGKVLFTTTPYNMGWLYQDFFKPWQEGKDPDLTVVTWASIDNPYFPKDFFEKEKTRLRPEEFNRRYRGEFTRMAGLVYPLHNFQIIQPKELRADITIGGIDWGFTNPAALLILKYYDGIWFAVDEWYEVGKTTREIIENAIALQNKWGVNRWYADSANPEKIAECSGTGLYVMPYDKGHDALSAGISYCQQLMNENRFYVFNSCKNYLTEAESYAYPEMKEGRPNLKDVPVPVNNHLMDAMRYAIHGYQPARMFPVKIPTVNDEVRRLLNNKTDNGSREQTSYE